MFIRLVSLIFISGLAFAAETPAEEVIPCEILAVKNTCWQNFKVDFSFKDAISLKEVHKFSIDKDKFQHKVKLNCVKNAARMFVTNFSPAIWQGDLKRRFHSKKIWQIPDSLPKNKSTYQIKILLPR